MKRFFFSLIALTAAVVGCTQSAMLETPDLGGAAVSFSPYTGRTPVTKATTIAQPDDQGTMPEGSVTLGEAGGFNVFGFLTTDDGKTTKTTILDAMNNEHVTYTDADGWTYDGLVYWPDKASTSTMSFVAYSHNAANYITWKGNKTTTEQVLTYTVPEDIDDQVDFLATALQDELSLNNPLSSGGTVTLNFHHLLSRIGFKVQTTTSTGVKIKALSLSGRMYVAGELNLKAVKGTEIPVLQVPSTATKQNPEYHYIREDEAASQISRAKDEAQRVQRDGSEFLMILPHTVRQGDDHFINVTYQVGNGNDREVYVELPADFEFKPGKAYEFILKISTSSISFQVEENGWNNVQEEGTTYPIEPTPEEAVILGAAYSITSESAIIPLTINQDDLDEVGIKYRAAGSDAWEKNVISKENGVYPIKSYNVTLGILDANTQYEYYAYLISDGVTTDPVSDILTFTTSSSISLSNEEPTPNSVKVNAITPDLNDTDISEFGICWIKGSGTPTVLDNLVTNAAKDDQGNPLINVEGTSFSYTITGLDPNTTYTCRAYVKNTDGRVSYSANLAFTTKFAVQEEDNTGGNLTEGGEVPFQ
ncbi:MAG: fimbrillin family protein [Bacteroidales bacterium]|nr:fimbrillin family protein [Bacteroidales bacterium]